ncbi:MAG: hypothetical protein ACEPO2_12400 [Pelagibaca sp.]
MSEKHAPTAIKDAVDFYEQWPKLRSRMERLADRYPLAEDDAEVLSWMIRMVDMVGPQDITREK